MSVSSPVGTGVGRHTITGRGNFSLQPRASQVFQPGSAVVRRLNSALVEVPLSSAPRADYITVGTYVGQSTFTASSTADANGGALDANGKVQVVTVSPISEVGTGWFSTGTSTHKISGTNVDAPCFWFDDDTLYLDDLGGTLSFAGWVADVDAQTGKVALKSSEQMRVLYELYSQGQAVPGFTQDDAVRAVATSLPAGTFSNGVLTLTATGAFSTAQDGVTLAVGDKFVIPAGTITTLVVSAANSGVYEVTSLGATGVSATFTRTARFAQGAIITPETKLRVGPEGTVFHDTVWTAMPATYAKVVGTDDPRLAPDKVTQKVQLASSTFTITNVPIRDADACQVLARLNTANGTLTSTVGYGTPTAGVTVGGIGTGQVVVDALASGMGKNGTADTSFLTVTIFQ